MYYVVTLTLQPLKLSVTKTTRTPSSEASKKTVQRRASVIEDIRKTMSGGDANDYNVQQIAEIRRQSQNERERIIKEV